MPQELISIPLHILTIWSSNNYYRTFKPGYPVQRELTTLQSILQDQIGCNMSSEDSVTGGGVRYNDSQIRFLLTKNLLVSGNNYIDDLNGKVIVGSISGIRAKIRHLNVSAFHKPYTLYVIILVLKMRQWSVFCWRTLTLETDSQIVLFLSRWRIFRYCCCTKCNSKVLRQLYLQGYFVRYFIEILRNNYFRPI